MEASTSDRARPLVRLGCRSSHFSHMPARGRSYVDTELPSRESTNLATKLSGRSSSSGRDHFLCASERPVLLSHLLVSSVKSTHTGTPASLTSYANLSSPPERQPYAFRFQCHRPGHHLTICTQRYAPGHTYHTKHRPRLQGYLAAV